VPAAPLHIWMCGTQSIPIGRGGRVWICDWNWALLGAAWPDLVTLLLAVGGMAGDEGGVTIINKPMIKYSGVGAALTDRMPGRSKVAI
jgi:hypothetical protein